MRSPLALIALGLVAACVVWLLGWATRDAVVAAGGDWAAAVRNIAAWAGDASKVALGALIGGVAGLAAGWQNRQSARADRVRAYRIEQIRETEAVVSATFRGVREAVSSSSGLMLAWRTRGLQRTIEDALQADLQLIGEADALVALAKAYLQVAGKFPVGPFRTLPLLQSLWLGLVLLVRNPWDAADVEALDAARTECLAALRRQEERALRDEALAKPDPDELLSRIDLAAIQAAAARARG